MDERPLRAARLRGVLASVPPALVGILWMLSAGFLFAFLNTQQKYLSHHIHAPQVACLRYFLGAMVLLPVMFRVGLHAYWPQRFRLHVARGAIHSVGTVMWFTALPHVTLAQNSAIGFTGPIFTMLGAWLFLSERMYASRWMAVAIAFGGVLIVLWPDLALPDGDSVSSLLLLASAPIFAVSFLFSKMLTRHERPEAIVFWLGLFVAIFALPFAIVGFDFSSGGLSLRYAWQWPTFWQWALFVSCGVTGSAAHYCMTRAFHIADVSAVQPVRFFDLIWASLFGFLAFAHVPTPWALVGGSIICSATLWIARQERHRAPPLSRPPG